MTSPTERLDEELASAIKEFRAILSHIGKGLRDPDAYEAAVQKAESRITALFASRTEEIERREEALEMFRDEQKRDKASLLTPPEARLLVDFYDTGNDFGKGFPALLTKLRSISSPTGKSE